MWGELRRVLVPTMSGAQIPLGQIADLRFRTGPQMIRNENGLLTGYVYVDLEGSDVGGYVERAKQAVASRVSLPPGYGLEWSGKWENIQRVHGRLKLIVPVTLLLIAVLLYLNTRSWVKTFIVTLAVWWSFARLRAILRSQGAK